MLVLTALGVAVGVGMLVPLPSSSVVIGSSFLRAFMDVGFAAVALAIVSSASAEARRGRNLSYISSARSLGFAMGALGGGVLLEMLGFRNAFALMAVLPIAALLFVAVLPSGARPKGARRQAAWALLRSTGLTDLYVGTILRQVAINGAFSLLYVYMAILGIPPGMMGAVSALNTLTQVLALVLFGFVADRIGRRRVFLLGFALSALVPCILAVATNVIWMAAAYVTLGLSFSSLYVGSTAHIGDRVPQERQGTMLGLYETSRGLGGVVGPLVAGALAPMAGFRGMFLAMGGIAVLSFLVMFVGRFRVRWNQRFGP